MLGAIGGPRARPQIAGLVRRLHRYRHFFGPQRSLLQLHLLLLGRERRRDGAAPLIVEVGSILLVDMLLLFRCRVRTRDIEMPVLHEIEIAVAAAGLAPSGEFRMA